MLPLRFVGLLVILLAVPAWCKPAKNSEGEDYNEDDPSDYNDGDPEDGEDYAGTLEEPPQIVSKPESIHVRNGSTIWLHCLVKNAESYAVTWKRDDENLYYDSTAMTEDSNRIIRLANNTLVIYNATSNDTSDNYECSILKKPPVTIKHRVLVDDRAPPPHKTLIHVHPGKRVEVSAGENITLSCYTSIHPTPEIKWYHEDTRIPHTEYHDRGGHITIVNVNRHNSGRYQCLVEDGSEKPPVEAIMVVVNYAPEIEAKGRWVHTGLEVESDLTCIVHAHPHAKVTWYKNQKEVLPEPRRIEMKGDKSRHVLKILHTEQEDLGVYTCKAENRMGSAEKMIHLTGAPSQAVISGGEMTKTATGLHLKWRLESYSPITEYKLEYRRKGEEGWIVLKPTVTNGKGNQFTVEHTIEGLQPGSYEAILTARNDFGWSQPSKPHVFTGEYEVEEAENVKGSTGGASQPAVAIATLFLVILSCAFTSQ
ncbi:lachesin [Calliopsis andreniformis]|uniref:lachesin n=1 Tax=Calliopsis andreniformis TaxID=337506 RepID=UPI003FCE2DD7